MIRNLILSTILMCSLTIQAQIDINSLSNWSLNAELGGIPVKSNNSATLYGVLGQLGLNYSFKHFGMIGVYGQTMFYHQNLDAITIDSKIIDMNSIDYSAAGLSLGFRFRKHKIEVTPKLDIGYNLFVAKAIDYNIDRTSFLDYRYLSLNPKLYLGYCVTPFTTFGVNGGYYSQVKAYKGNYINEFNPNGFNLSIYCSFFFRSNDFLPKENKKDGKESEEKNSNKDIQIPYFK